MRRAASVLLLLALAAATPAGRQTAADPNAERIDRVVSRLLSTNGPGLALAVVKNGDMAFSSAWGLADVERRARLRTDSAFDLASCSKQFTAMAVLLLAEQHRLSLDDDARKYLPELPVFDRARPIRVVDMLHMVSGLASYQELVHDKYDGVTNEDVARLVGKAPLRFPTGTKYEYSNTDYNLLALIVKRASGMSYGAFLKAHVFTPLRMTRSVVLDHKGQTIPGRTFGYEQKRTAWRLDENDTHTLVGDGNVFSTVEDLAKWDRALRWNTLVPEATIEQAFTSGLLDSGRTTNYGFGWEIGHGNQAGIVSHPGSWNGTSTYITRNLRNGVTVIVLSNISDFDTDTIGNAVLGLYR